MLKKTFLTFFLVWVLFVSHQGAAQSPYINKLQHTKTLTRQNPDVAFLQIKGLLQEALAKEDDYAIASCYEQIGEVFYYQAAYSQALDNYFKADNLFRKGHYTTEVAANLNRIGQTYYYTRQYLLALKTFKEALAIYQKANNRRGVAESYGFIGQAFEKSADYKQAFAFQYLALKEFKLAGDETGIAKIYENLGSVYEDKLQLDSALKNFQLALQLNVLRDDKMAQIEVINNIGDIHRKTGNLKGALVHTHKAASMAKSMKEQYQLASAYRDLSKIFNLMGRNDSAYHYSEAGRDIFLDIFSEDSKKQLMVLQTLFEIEQKDNAISQYKQDQKSNRIITFSAILIVLLLISLGISIISRQRLNIKNQQILNEQNKTLYEAQSKAMQADLYTKQLKEESLKGELELKSKELTTHTLHLIQKNQLLEELKAKLNAIIRDDKRDQRRELRQVINLISFSSNQDKNWDDFRIVFERVHEHFFDSLRKYSTSLTPSDLRLVALLKMNLSSGDIATLLGISQDSLRIARYRLKKKLNLDEGENLSSFIQNL